MSQIIEIHICTRGGSAMQRVQSAELIAHKGIKGDRYFKETGTFSEKLAGLPDKELTLIEAEQIQAFNKAHGLNFTYGDFRRNLITEGVDLNSLVGKEFMLGNIRLKGVRLCEPCSHLASILVPEVVSSLAHKSGLRVTILDDGKIQDNTPITMP